MTLRLSFLAGYAAATAATAAVVKPRLTLFCARSCYGCRQRSTKAAKVNASEWEAGNEIYEQASFVFGAGKIPSTVRFAHNLKAKRISAPQYSQCGVTLLPRSGVQSLSVHYSSQ